MEFQAACDGAKIAAGSHFYDYAVRGIEAPLRVSVTRRQSTG